MQGSAENDQVWLLVISRKGFSWATCWVQTPLQSWERHSFSVNSAMLFGQKLFQFKTARGAPVTQGINPYCRTQERSGAAAVTAHEKDKINSWWKDVATPVWPKESNSILHETNSEWRFCRHGEYLWFLLVSIYKILLSKGRIPL